MTKATAKPRGAALPELVLIFVSPDCRGHGLGGELVATCEAFLDVRAVQAYTVSTEELEGNRALNFYLSQGFLVTGRALRHGLRYIVLQKTLGPSVDSDL